MSNLSEEEKKAIEDLKKILEYWQTIVDIKDPIEREIEMNMYSEEMPFYQIKQALNLIDRLQKELEYYKEKEKAYKKEYFEEVASELQKENEELKAKYEMARYRIDVIDERELISKDKIKEIKGKEISRIQKILGKLNTNDILNSYTKKYTDIDMSEYAGMEINRVLEDLLKEN